MLHHRIGIAIGTATVILLASGCAQGTPAATSSGPTSAAAGRKVILIANQPKDPGTAVGEIVTDGLDVCAKAGWTTQAVVVTDVNAYESTIRTAVSDGYNLIATTFPPMSDATSAVAADNPATQFLGIYQFSNMTGTKLANLWSTEYSYEQSGYLWGVAAAKLTKTGKIGVVNGQAEPSGNAIINGLIAGAMSVLPSVKVTVTYTGTYTDPAKGSANAKALVSAGADVLVGMADQSNIGVIDIAKSSHIPFLGDTATRIPSYPEGFVAALPLTFGEPLADACAGKFQGGAHTVYPLSVVGAQTIVDQVKTWAAKTTTVTDAQTVVSTVETAWADIQSKKVTVPRDGAEPKSSS